MSPPTVTESNGCPSARAQTIRGAVRRRFWAVRWIPAFFGNAFARSLIHFVNVLAWLFVVGMVGWSLGHSAVRRSSRHLE